MGDRLCNRCTLHSLIRSADRFSIFRDPFGLRLERRRARSRSCRRVCMRSRWSHRDQWVPKTTWKWGLSVPRASADTWHDEQQKKKKKKKKKKKREKKKKKKKKK